MPPVLADLGKGTVNILQYLQSGRWYGASNRRFWNLPIFQFYL